MKRLMISAALLILVPSAARAICCSADGGAGCGSAGVACATPLSASTPCPVNTWSVYCANSSCVPSGPTWTPTQTATATATTVVHTNYYASAVAAYNMETGALGTDSSGSNTMTVTGTVTANATHQQGSWSGAFDGSTGVLECASGSCAPLHIAGGAFSLIGWFYFPSSPSGDIAYWGLHFGAFGWKTDISGGPHFEGQIDNSLFQIKNVVSTTTLGTATWYHMGFVYDGANLNMYVNGVSDATPVAQTGNINAPTARVTLGGAYDLASAGTLSEQFNGQEDEVLIFNTALTAKQVCEACRFGAAGATSDRGATCGTCTWQ